MDVTFFEHPNFVKVVSKGGDTLARCDKMVDSCEWKLVFWVAGKMIVKMVPAADAASMVKAAALLACAG